MTRRSLVARAFRRGSPDQPTCKPPEDEPTWNHFVDTCNKFTAVLNRGVVDMRLWKKTTDAWKAMTGC